MIVVSNGAIICVIMLSCVVVHCRVVHDNKTVEDDQDSDKRLININYKHELDGRDASEVRKEKSGKNKQNLLTRILPMLATPFILQSTFLPMVLLGIKFMLIQSIFLGKMAIIFWTVNLIRNKILDQQGQFYSHNVHLPHH